MNNSRSTHYDSFNQYIQKRINLATRSILYKSNSMIQSLKTEVLSKETRIQDLLKLIEKERREKEQREKEQREKEQREKEQGEKEQREKEQREKKQREKEQRDKEQGEKEQREIKQREKEQREKEQHEKEQREKEQRKKISEPEQGCVETVVFPHHLSSYLTFLITENDKVNNPKLKQTQTRHNERKRHHVNFNHQESYRISRNSNFREKESFHWEPPIPNHDAYKSKYSRFMKCNYLTQDENLEFNNATLDENLEILKDDSLIKNGTRHYKRAHPKRNRKKSNRSYQQ